MKHAMTGAIRKLTSPALVAAPATSGPPLGEHPHPHRDRRGDAHSQQPVISTLFQSPGRRDRVRVGPAGRMPLPRSTSTDSGPPGQT